MHTAGTTRRPRAASLSNMWTYAFALVHCHGLADYVLKLAVAFLRLSHMSLLCQPPKSLRSERAHGVKRTSYECRCDVMTSPRRCLRPCACRTVRMYVRRCNCPFKYLFALKKGKAQITNDFVFIVLCFSLLFCF